MRPLRNQEYLRQRYAAIVSAVGMILLMGGILMSSPLLVLLVDREEFAHAASFIEPAGSMILLGWVLWRGFRRPLEHTLTVPEGGIVVVVSWILVILFSAWPFTSILGLAYSRSVFEAVSGWTTTGLSVVDVATAGRMVLLWRSVIQMVGGAGLAVLMMSAVVGPVGVGITSAEGRGDQLAPNVRRSAHLVLIIYIGYALSGILAYRVVGMSWFDAVNHSFAAVSTGGVSTRVENIGYWNSAAVEAVSVVLMILGNMSFVTAWLLWRGKLRLVMKNGEVRLMAFLIPVSIAAAFLWTTSAIYPRMEKAIRVAVFETVSALTTTGFSSVVYDDWNGFGVFMLVVLMLIGGGTCSTAGGIKQFRVHLLWRMLCVELRRQMLPRTAVSECAVWEGDKRVFVDDGRVRQVMIFLFVYLAIYVLGVLNLCACGFRLADSLFEFASALGTVGLSIGVTSAGMPDAALWAETIAMFLGRLEFFVVFVSLAKMTEDGRGMLTASG